MTRIAVVLSFAAGFSLMMTVGEISSKEMQKASWNPIASEHSKVAPAAKPTAPVESPDTPVLDETANAAEPEVAEAGPEVAETEPEVAEAEPEAEDTPQKKEAQEAGQAEQTPETEEAPAEKETQTPSGKSSREALAGVDLSAMKLSRGKYRQTTKDGRKILFTVNSALQKYTDGILDQYDVPAGAAVLLNSKTGRVIAISQKRHTADAAPSAAVALDATPPAASIFKIVTAAALIDNGILPTKKTCYSGGSGGLDMRHLADTLPKNHACVTMSRALGHSVNAVFAKLADKFLNRKILSAYAERFGFNRPLEFDVPVEISSAKIPEERLERARTAAGFWHTHLSPIHAASIAQALAQNGAALRPYVVDKVTDASGNTLYESKTKYLRHLVSKETATLLKQALAQTTAHGTARKSFHDAAGRPFLPGIEVAGKTGTLTGSKPYRAYTWFVGLAPVDKPEVAVAVLIVNTPKWRIKAPQAAAMILKKYFDTIGRKSR